jgi:hypothetical protein
MCFSHSQLTMIHAIHKIWSILDSYRVFFVPAAYQKKAKMSQLGENHSLIKIVQESSKKLRLRMLISPTSLNPS